MNLLDISYYFLLSLTRMLFAYIISLVVAFMLGYSMYKWKLFNLILFPLIDFLQTVPILSFFPVALLVFIESFDGMGVELAVVFLITTSMVWNLIFSVYESLVSFPKKYKEIANILNVGLYNYAFKFYLPFALPSIVSNSMVSWANGWYFLIATEIITILGRSYVVDGIGSYLYFAAIELRWLDVFISIILISSFILVVNKFFWNPLMNRRINIPFNMTFKSLFVFLINMFKFVSFFFAGVVVLLMFSFFYFLLYNVGESWIYLYDSIKAFFSSYLRIWGAYILSLLWIIPTMFFIYKYKADYIARFFEILASIPLPSLFPFIIYLLVKGFGIEVVSLIFLMTGMQWYVFFNIYGAVKSLPTFLEGVKKMYRISDIRYVKLIAKPILSLFVVGSIAAFGGGWNAVMLAEYIKVGDEVYSVFGIGSKMMESLYAEDISSLSLYTLVVGFLAPLLNIVVWKPLIERYKGLRV